VAFGECGGNLHKEEKERLSVSRRLENEFVRHADLRLNQGRTIFYLTRLKVQAGGGLITASPSRKAGDDKNRNVHLQRS